MEYNSREQCNSPFTSNGKPRVRDIYTYRKGRMEQYKLYGKLCKTNINGVKACDIGWFGFFGYCITEDGRVWSSKQHKFLSQNKDRRGYYRVSLPFRVGDKLVKMVTIRIHRLVAMAFLENPENKPQVNHIDGVKEHNCVSNLEWVTNHENAIHSRTNNLMPHAVFNDTDVHRICKALSKGVRIQIIADKYGYPYRSVQAIHLGRNWTHISEKYKIGTPPARVQLSEADRQEIVRLLNDGKMKRRSIAQKFLIDVSTVHKIAKRFCK